MAELSGLTRRELLGGASIGGLAVAATLAGPAATARAQEAGSSLSLASAQTMINAALAQAREIGVPMTVVVVDDGGNLKAAARMDGTGFGGIEIVMRKAVTAAGFRSPTQTLGERAQSDPARFASFANLPQIWLGGGGLPVMRGTELLGGIGAGGGTAEQDTEVAQAGLAAFS